MLSLRLQTIISLIDKDLSVVDIGTDHAYIPIYLVNNNITTDVLATDISPKVIDGAIKNIKNNNLENKIKVKVTDGLNDIDKLYDIAIIAGMGTSTIKKILDNKMVPNTLIIQSNNDHEDLRKYLNSSGYKIDKEIVIKENKKYYVIIKFIKGKEKLTKRELLFGKSNNYEYYLYLFEKYTKLYEKSQKNEFANYINILKDIIEKKLD